MSTEQQKIQIPYQGKTNSLLTTNVTIKQYCQNFNFQTQIIENSLIDCGSMVTIITKNILDKERISIQSQEKTDLTDACGNTIATADQNLHCNIIIGDYEISNCDILVINNESTRFKYNLIVGLDIIKLINTSNNILSFKTQIPNTSYQLNAIARQNKKEILFVDTN